jgi:CIC family chloride channel protein
VLAAATGAVTGAGVAAFEWLTRDQVFDRLLASPVWAQAVALPVGLALTALALRAGARLVSPMTSDAYIENFHQPDRPLPLQPALRRLAAGAATLGTGGAMGYEGPSLYLGAVVGSAVHRRWERLMARADSKVLMVAGAAAGVAAIFKAPATGAVFALEVPYRDDTARHMLLPALLAAAAGYLSFVALMGIEPLFTVDGTPPFDYRELGGAAALGLVCGVGARGFAWLIHRAKRLNAVGHPALRIAVASVVLVALLLASNALYGASLSTGSGYRALRWVTEPEHGVGLILALLGMRVVATAATVSGGGVGGLFVPLVVAGALVGDAAATAIGDTTNLFPVIGVAAFLGAGYRTPLAGVMFVAETTGRPGFIVPGLIASVVAQLVMGDASVASYQTAGRVGHLERRFELPIGSAIRSDVPTIPPDASMRELYENLLLLRETSVAVLDGNRYVGMISSYDLQEVELDEWPTTMVRTVMHRDWPVAHPDWKLERAVRAMEEADRDTLPVLDDSSAFVGVVSRADIVRLDEILRRGDDSQEA